MAEKKKKKTKTNPGAEAGFTQGMMTAKLLADSEERYGFVTPKSAKSSQEKPGGGYKGEECLEEDDPNDPNDPSECV